MNLFLNAYINRHAHTEYLKMIEVYSPLGIWHVFLFSTNTKIYHFRSMGAQWLSGRVLDSRQKGRGFEPHRRHCVVVLEQDTFILA